MSVVSHRLEEVSAMDCGDLSLTIPSVVGRVEHMELQFGQETVLCSALVVGESVSPFFLCFPDSLMPSQRHLKESLGKM